MNETDLNRLPVPTWNQCGVNSAPRAAALPEVPQGGFSVPQCTAPDTLPEGTQQGVMHAFRVHSGLGEQADAYILQHANIRHAYTTLAGADAAQPLMLETVLDDAHPHAVSVLALYAAQNSSVTLVQTVRGDAEDGIAASLTQIHACENAHVRLVQVQLLGSHARRWNAVAVEQEKGARVEQVRIELGGSLSVCGTRALLGENKCEYDLDAVYFGADDAVLDYNDVSVHTGRDTLCEMHTAGVLTGHANKILRGTIDFRPGAKRGVGHESEDVLLFSPNARNRTAPLILCGEEEVEGQHAASIGRLDEEKLYYLRSRGLTQAAARRLMVDARFAPAIEKIPTETLREQVRLEAARRLDAYAD